MRWIVLMSFVPLVMCMDRCFVNNDATLSAVPSEGLEIVDSQVAGKFVMKIHQAFPLTYKPNEPIEVTMIAQDPSLRIRDFIVVARVPCDTCDTLPPLGEWTLGPSTDFALADHCAAGNSMAYESRAEVGSANVQWTPPTTTDTVEFVASVIGSDGKVYQQIRSPFIIPYSLTPGGQEEAGNYEDVHSDPREFEEPDRTGEDEGEGARGGDWEEEREEEEEGPREDPNEEERYEEEAREESLRRDREGDREEEGGEVAREEEEEAREEEEEEAREEEEAAREEEEEAAREEEEEEEEEAREEEEAAREEEEAYIEEDREGGDPDDHGARTEEEMRLREEEKRRQDILNEEEASEYDGIRDKLNEMEDEEEQFQNELMEYERAVAEEEKKRMEMIQWEIRDKEEHDSLLAMEERERERESNNTPKEDKEEEVEIIEKENDVLYDVGSATTLSSSIAVLTVAAILKMLF